MYNPIKIVIIKNAILAEISKLKINLIYFVII